MSEASASNVKLPCSAARKDGSGCRAPALADGLCFAHSATTAEARTAARKRGGRNRSNASRLRSLAPPRLLPIFDQLEQALADVLDGSLAPGQATAAAAVSRALVAILSAGELEERVRALEGNATP